MKLLIMSPYAPYPPNSGGRMRIWEQIRYFGARHDLTLVSFYQAAHEGKLRDAYLSYCRAVYLIERPSRPQAEDLEQFRSIGDLFQWYTTPEMEQVHETLKDESFDVVNLHHIFMAHYGSWFNAFNVLEEQNIESEIYKQHAEFMVMPTAHERTFRQTRWLMLKRYEDEMWAQFPLRVVVSADDKRAMQARGVSGETLVVENGFDVRGTAMLPPSNARQILFMGSLDFYPNIDGLLDFCETTLHEVWARDPKIKFVIAGRHPPERIRSLTADPRIRVIPNPADMTEIARESALTIVPLRMGSGTRLKILHSMALGRPVVATSKGSQGLTVTDGQDILIRDEPKAFADAILRALNDAALAERLRIAGRHLVETRYDWSQIWGAYERELLRHVGVGASV